jgi:hypothetical protein
MDGSTIKKTEKRVLKMVGFISVSASESVQMAWFCAEVIKYFYVFVKA